MSIIGTAFVAIDPDTTAMEGGLESKLKGIFSGAGVIGAVAVLGVAIGATLLAIGSKFEEMNNDIISKTGASGTALTGLEASAKKVFSDTLGATFANVGDTISELSVRTGLTGQALDAMAQKEIELGKVTKTDVGSNVQATTALFNNFGIAAKNQSAQLDVLFKASQQSGVGFQTFTASMQSAAPVAQTLGLNIDQTAALVANLSKAGLPASKVMAGMSAEFAKAAKAGKDPTTVINDMVTAIKSAPNATAAATIAMGQYGIGARQAATLVDAVRSGSLNLSTTLASISGSGGGIVATANATATMGDKFKLFKNQAETALAPVAAKVLDFANTLVGKIPGAFETIKTALTPLVAAFAPFVKTLISDIPGAFATVKQVILGFVSDIAPTLEKIAQAGSAAFDFILKNKPELVAALVVIGAAIAINMVPVFIAWAAATWAEVAAMVALWAPVIALVAAAALVAAGIVYAYTHFKVFRDVVNEVASILKGVLIGAFHAVEDVIKTAIGIFMDLIHFVEDIFKGHWSAAFSALADIPKKIIGLVIKLFEDLGPSILKALGALGSLALKGTELLGSFLLGLVKKLPDILLWFAKLPLTILAGLGDLTVTLVSKGLDLLGGLLSGLISKLPSIGLWFVELPLRIVGFLIAADIWLLIKGGEIIAGLVKGLVNALPSIGKWFADLPGVILGFLVSAATWLVQVGSDVITGLWNGIKATWATSVTFLTQLPGLIVSGLSNAATWLVKTGGDIITGLWNGIKSLWTGGISFFTNLPTTIENLVKGAASWLLKTGGDIIQGLINGITGGIGAIGKAMGNVVSSIKKAITNPLSILSPSKVFQGYGENIMQGLANGITGSGALPTAALGNVVAKLGTFQLPNLAPGAGGSNTAAAAGGLGGGGAAGGITINQSIHPSRGMSETQVGRISASQISWQAKPRVTGGR